MKTVILCGGFGTRLRGTTGPLPKPLVEVAKRPILWHVMQLYARRGFTEFVLCLGFGGAPIQDHIQKHPADFLREWQIQCVDTGLETPTGGRIKKVEPFIQGDTFFVTYADGVSDVDLTELLAFHHRHGRIGTLLTVNPSSQFGEILSEGNGRVTRFAEKPKLDRWINGGFFAFNRKFFSYLQEDSTLEKEPLENLARDGQLYGFKHNGFWCCMDTYKDTLLLNELCRNGNSPWGAPRP